MYVMYLGAIRPSHCLNLSGNANGINDEKTFRCPDHCGGVYRPLNCFSNPCPVVGIV